MTKRRRLFNALAERQNKDRVGNCVVAFMNEAMAPVRYRDNPAAFSRRQDDVNEVLIHAGYRITDQGKVERAKGGKATTLERAAGAESGPPRSHGAHRRCGPSAPEAPRAYPDGNGAPCPAGSSRLMSEGERVPESGRRRGHEHVPCLTTATSRA